MRRRALLFSAAIACAHPPATQRPVAVTQDLIGNLRVALPGEPVIQVDDSDCDAHDRSRVTASFEELREAMVKHGFTVVEPADANVLLEHRTHVTTCTFDGQIEGSAQLVAKDKSGRTIEIASLFPLWPEGLIELLLTSEHLADFARNPKAAPKLAPPPPPSLTIAATSSSAVFSIRPMEGEIDPALADQLVDYLVLRLTESGALARDDSAPGALTSKLLRVGDRCVLSAALFRAIATERGGCSTDELMDAVDRVASRLTKTSGSTGL